MVGVSARRRAGERLDAAHAGRDRALADHRDQPDVAGAAHVGAAAQLDRPAHGVAAGFVSPMATTRTSSPYFSPNSARAPDAMASSTAISRVVTGEFCSTTSLAMSSTRSISCGRHRLGMREVEAQPVGRHQRALLRHVIAEHLAQRLVQQVGRRMMLADGAAARMIDLERERRADLERALLDRAGMHEQVARLLLGVGDAKAHAVARASMPVSPTWPPDSP